jgi:hypothetical protein
MNTRSWIQTRERSPYGQGGYGAPYAPSYASSPYAYRRPWVGLSPSDPGSGWGQAPTAQEQAQGYKKTDVMTLSIKVGQLRAKVEDLVAQADPSTDAGSMALLTKLASDVVALDTAVAYLLSSGGTPTNNYPLDLIRYNALQATYDSFGIEQVVAPAPKASPAAPAPAPVTTTVKPAAPSAPTIVKKPASSWGYWLAGGLALVGVALIGAGVLK